MLAGLVLSEGNQPGKNRLGYVYVMVRLGSVIKDFYILLPKSRKKSKVENLNS